MEQEIIRPDNNYEGLTKWLDRYRKVMVVCGNSVRSLDVYMILRGTRFEDKLVWFSDFTPNPDYSQATEGVRIFRQEDCDAIIAIGGGSAMDVAKCIKLFSALSSDGKEGEYLQLYRNALVNQIDIPYLAMPTTAGTGSEATRFAVLYYRGVKQSIAAESIIPNAILMDPATLKTLPIYQKKATMLDALSHAIESYWSVNSTRESREYSATSLITIVNNYRAYLDNDEAGNRAMLNAAHLAGKAINISQTTAGHAMCYKITSLFGLAHGHAAALCNRVLYKWMVEKQASGECVVIDPRGEKYLSEIMSAIGRSLGCNTAEEGAQKLEQLFDELELSVPEASKEQFDQLVSSINPERMKNHPVELDEIKIAALYKLILREKNESGVFMQNNRIRFLYGSARFAIKGFM